MDGGVYYRLSRYTWKLLPHIREKSCFDAGVQWRNDTGNEVQPYYSGLLEDDVIFECGMKGTPRVCKFAVNVTQYNRGKPLKFFYYAGKGATAALRFLHGYFLCVSSAYISGSLHVVGETVFTWVDPHELLCVLISHVHLLCHRQVLIRKF